MTGEKLGIEGAEVCIASHATDNLEAAPLDSTHHVLLMALPTQGSSTPPILNLTIKCKNGFLSDLE